MNENPIYFKSLNGIRALAAIIVVIWHLDQFSFLFGIESNQFYLNGMASRAVDLFFVLSGFLITFLLLKEKEIYGTIEIKKFYIRRILRIWPLYYLAVFITLIYYYYGIIDYNESFSLSLVLYLFLLANLAFVLNIDFKSITPLWSVGVEEQFYALWPHIINKCYKFKYIFHVLFIVFTILKICIIYSYINQKSLLVEFIQYFRINIMMIGSVGAYWLFYNNKVLKIIYSQKLQILCWLIFVISIFYKPIHIRSFIDSEINSVIYLILILNLSSNNKSLINFENRIFNFLGKISYGIYVFHMLVIYLISFLFNKLSIRFNNFLELSILTLFLTISFAYLSYEFYEKKFILLKHKFMKIKSTNIKEI